ncbi:phage-related protein [Moritella sp. PE36]|nr:phage-related protein [Moritella sp. PE36]
MLDAKYKAHQNSAPRFTPIGCTFKQAAQYNDFIITGGFADGVTVWNALGCPDDVCILAIVGEKNAPNLVRQLRQIKPGCSVVVALDNDSKSRTGQRVCMESVTRWVVPGKPGDWNDIYVSQGLNAVALELDNVRDPLPDFNMWQVKALDTEDGRQKKKMIQLLSALSPDAPEAIARTAITLLTRCQSDIFTVHGGERPFFNWLICLNPFMSVETSESLKRRIEIVSREIARQAKDQISIDKQTTGRHNYKRYKKISEAVNSALNHFGVTVVKAPHAGGKTSVLGIPFFNDAKARGEYITVLAHLRTLVADLVNKFKTNHYDDVKEESLILGLQLNESTRQYTELATCLPSIIGKLESLVDRTQVLIIDEVSQVVRMITAKLNGMNNVAVYEKLKYIINKAASVLVLDADLDTATLEFLEYCRPGERFNIIAVPNPTALESGMTCDWFYGDGYRDYVTNSIKFALENDQRSIVACDWCGNAEKLHAMLVKEYPEKSFLLITSKTTDKPYKPASKFMGNANVEAAKYDCIIHSPSIRSGLSITDVKFDIGFGLFGGGSIIPQDCIQMLRRARMVKHWVIGVAEIFSALLEDEWLLNEQQQILSDESKNNYGVTASSHDFDTLKNKIESKESRAKNNFSAYLYVMLAEYGFKVNMINIEEIDQADCFEQFSKEYNEEFKAAIIAADMPTDDEYDRLTDLGNPTLADDAAIACYVICKSCGIESVCETWLSFYKDRGVVKAKRMMWAKHLPELSEDDSEASSLHAFKKVRGAEVRKLMNSINYAYQEDFELTESNAEKLIDHMWSRKDRLIFLGLLSPQYSTKRYSNKQVDKPRPTKPIKFAKETLIRFGVMTNRSRRQISGDRQPILLTNNEKQKMINHVIEHQFSYHKH